MPVLRIKSLKFKNYKRIFKHRCPDCEEKEIKIFYEELRKIETLEGRKNLRKDASFYEIVISYPNYESDANLERDLETLISLLVEKFNYSPNWFYYVAFKHYKKGRNHIHLVFTGRDKNLKKVRISPRDFENLKREFLKKLYPVEYLIYERKKYKNLKTYPLWSIRVLENITGDIDKVSDFVSLCRKNNISKGKFVGLVLQIRDKEISFEEIHRELKNKLTSKQKVKKTQKFRRGFKR